jgi:hypothetical protein
MLLAMKVVDDGHQRFKGSKGSRVQGSVQRFRVRFNGSWEFRRFLRIARGSLTETHNHLRDGRDRGYLTDAKHEELSRLTARAAGATTRLMVYLHSCKPKAHGG